MKAARGVKFQPVSSRSSARDSQYIRSGAKCQPVSRPSGSAKGFRPRSRQTDGRCQTTSRPTSSAKGFRPQSRHINGKCQPLSRPTSSAKGFRPRSRFTRRAMSTEDNSNGNLCGAVTGGTGSTTSTPGPGLLKPTSSSTEDLSEYTDADESISAPTEFLAEFLSAVMLKDYETALKYCKLILQYEPNNVTAKEFYPLILEKLQNTYNNSSSRHYPTPSSSSSSPSPSPGSSSSSASSSSSDEEGDGDVDDGPDGDDVDGDPEEDEEEENSGKRSSDGDATTASYSSLEDEEVDRKERVDNVDIGNGNHIIRDSRGAAWEVKGMSSSGPVTVPFGTSSDSESPTEPVSQQTIAMLRAKVIPPRH